jgi:hypothetical protein
MEKDLVRVSRAQLAGSTGYIYCKVGRHGKEKVVYSWYHLGDQKVGEQKRKTTMSLEDDA